VVPRERERARRLIRELRSLVDEREHQFRDLGADSMEAWHARRRDGVDLGGYGEVFLLIDSWGALVRELPELEPEIGELAALGLHFGVHVVLSANRWAEVRPGLRENLGGRLELHLNDPLESEVGRVAAAGCPTCPGAASPRPGSSSRPPCPARPKPSSAAPAPPPAAGSRPPLRLLPTLVEEAALMSAGNPRGGPASGQRGHPPAPRAGSRGHGGGGPGGLPFAVEEHRLEVVELDLFGGSPQLLVFGDAGCGKSSLLRLIARGTAARSPASALGIVVVDPRRGWPT
jgi:S-DNA-T family DNA segregation ATPase FtsK/SpoIIIE